MTWYHHLRRRHRLLYRLRGRLRPNLNASTIPTGSFPGKPQVDAVDRVRTPNDDNSDLRRDPNGSLRIDCREVAGLLCDNGSRTRRISIDGRLARARLHPDDPRTFRTPAIAAVLVRLPSANERVPGDRRLNQVVGKLRSCHSLDST